MESPTSAQISLFEHIIYKYPGPFTTEQAQTLRADFTNGKHKEAFMTLVQTYRDHDYEIDDKTRAQLYRLARELD
jgi:hypothetical protein